MRPRPKTTTDQNYEAPAVNAGSNVDPTHLFNNVEMKKKAADEFYKFGDNNIGTNSNTHDVMMNYMLLADHNENEELDY